MKLFQELAEGRMLRSLDSVKGLTGQDLVERIFEHLIALQLLAYSNPKKAKSYAEQLCQASTFDSFRSMQTDLYNFLVLLMRPESYEGLVKNNIDVDLPEYFIRRQIRAIADGRMDSDGYNQMMLMLQRQFKNIPGRLINFRREASEFPDFSAGRQKLLINLVLQNMRERAHWVNSDLYVLLNSTK